jgi:hypothetical protein
MSEATNIRLDISVVEGPRLSDCRQEQERQRLMDMDPRWEWVEIASLTPPYTRYIKSRCLHRDVVPVEVAGEVVAQLCETCDSQLPAEWRP